MGRDMGAQVAQAAARWRDAVERAEMERAYLMQEAQEAAAAGVSEYMIADWAGVQRSTVRGWLGKR